MKKVRSLVGAGAILISFTAVANDKVSVFVEYRHGPVHVHFSLPCTYSSLCTLTSLEGSAIPWLVEVTPVNQGNGIISVTTAVTENSVEVSRANVLNKLGEEAKIVSTGPDGEPSELTIRAYQ